MKKNFAVIGYGGQGGWHTRQILASDVAALTGIYDIDPKKAELAEKNGKRIRLVTNEEITEAYDLLVHASPVGMYPKVGVSPITAEQVDLFKQVYDIVYNPVDTELLKIAKEKGKVCGGGLSMLVCQAMRGQTHGLGVEFTREEAATVIERSAKELERVFGK